MHCLDFNNCLLLSLISTSHSSFQISNINFEFSDQVPSDAVENDCIPASIKGWTALSFAVVGGHANIVKVSVIPTSLTTQAFVIPRLLFNCCRFLAAVYRKGVYQWLYAC